MSEPDDEVALPTGRQLEIRHGRQRAIVVEVGGALRRYDQGEQAILDGYDAGEMCSGARGQTLIPWPNRIKDGRYTFNGQPLTLALSEPDKHNAIHGLVRWTNWTVREQQADRVTVAHRLHAQKGWPFVLDVAIEYRLDDAGLTVRTTATNRGAAPCPYGAGAHPYLTLGAPTIDDALLRIPARTYLDTDARSLPTVRRAVDGTPFDFRAPHRIGDLHIDYAFTDLERDSDGRARLELASADGSRASSLWVDEQYRWLEVFTGDTLEGAEKRRGLGVEPMTCPPNAFQSGEDLHTLVPGQSLTSTWGIEPRLSP